VERKILNPPARGVVSRERMKFGGKLGVLIKSIMCKGCATSQDPELFSDGGIVDQLKYPDSRPIVTSPRPQSWGRKTTLLRAA
jgi:hypothetical protein